MSLLKKPFQLLGWVIGISFWALLTWYLWPSWYTYITGALTASFVVYALFDVFRNNP